MNIRGTDEVLFFDFEEDVISGGSGRWWAGVPPICPD